MQGFVRETESLYGHSK